MYVEESWAHREGYGRLNREGVREKMTRWSNIVKIQHEKEHDSGTGGRKQ